MNLKNHLKKGISKPQINSESSDEETTKNDKSNIPILNSTIEPDNLFSRPKTNIKPIVKTIDKEKILSIIPSKNERQNSERYTIFKNIKSEKKKLDNSYEDYFFYEIVDDDSFELFMNFSQNYIAKRLNDKINRLYLSISRQITESFKNNFKDFNHPHNELINKVINKTLSKPVEKKGFFASLFKCCVKVKPKNRLIEYHNMQNLSYEIENQIINFITDLKENKFNEKAVEEITVLPSNETENLCKEKSNKFLHEKAVEERLREEIENYSKYFNIENILEKQKNTLEVQNKKMSKINETKELNVCIICMEKQRNVMFIPCYHLITCEDCGNNKVKDSCPECMKKIDQKTLIK
jgi:hypothetical protein